MTMLSTQPQPRIVAFLGDETVQYFILCERQVLCKLPILQVAQFTTSAYYCFNLGYPLEGMSMFSFFQDYVLGYPDSNKKSGQYLGVVCDIKHHL